MSWFKFEDFFCIGKLVNSLKNFEKYFKNEVKVINSVGLEEDGDVLRFHLNIPSTEFTISLERNDEKYYLDFESGLKSFQHVEISEQEFETISNICKSINQHVVDNKDEFRKAKAELIEQIIELIKNQIKLSGDETLES